MKDEHFDYLLFDGDPLLACAPPFLYLNMNFTLTATIKCSLLDLPRSIAAILGLGGWSASAVVISLVVQRVVQLLKV